MKTNNKIITALLTADLLTGGLAYAKVSQIYEPQQILDYLMQAELAASRNLHKESLANYLIEAQMTKDPEITQLATEHALELKDQTAPIIIEAQSIALSFAIEQTSHKSFIAKIVIY